MIIKIQPDVPKAQALKATAEITLQRLGETDREKYPTNTLTDYYDSMHKLMDAISSIDGIKAKGDGAHKELIDYIAKTYAVEEPIKDFLQQMREYRNRIAYEGFSIHKNYILNNDEKIQMIIKKLSELIDKKMMKNQYQDPWATFAQKYKPSNSPITPSAGDLAIVEKYLKQILQKTKKPDVHMLGCTFGYRKLLAQHKIPVVLVDLQENMYKINTEILEEEKCEKRQERFVKENWCTMNLGKEFDLILGDFVIENIMKEHKDAFFVNIRKHLKKDGLFITRNEVQTEKNEPEEAFFAKYKNKKITSSLIDDFWFDVLKQFGMDRQTDIMSNKDAWEKCVKTAEKYPFMKELVKQTEQQRPVGDHKLWCVLPYAEQKAEIERYFTIIEMAYGKDYPHWNVCPTHVCGKK